MENNLSYPILEKIKSPDDVKSLDNTDLDELCSEIRRKLINTVSQTGGHLASNLGTVELTVALHRTFNLPADKIIWDVGHQAYTHKILTGRFDVFDTLRQEGGISGFVRPDESKYDSFYEGHAGTSVSQAEGIAEANRFQKNKNYTVAVIGDGSFGNGMVYEALNQTGASKDRLIVILNDNEMSISENVSSVARHLAVVRAKPEYYRFKATTEKALRKIPLVGKYLARFVFKIKSLLKSVIYNNSSYFEKFGFRYIGPIDGHDINTLCEALNSAKLVVDKPVLLHINTIKGKGYDFAENSPDLFHGIPGFDINTGDYLPDKCTYSSVFGDALCDFAGKDKRICAVTAAMSIGTGLSRFFSEYPDRAYDVGIAEEHAVTFCSGLSAGGMLPVFAVYSTFMQRCVDQLIHDGALQRNKIVVAVDRAGFVGADGETHQGLFDVPLLESLPLTTVYSPATYNDLRNAMYNAFYKDSNLVVIRYPRGSEDENYSSISSGGDYDIFNENSPVFIVTYGKETFEAMKAIQALKNKGIDVGILKLNKIKPLKTEAVGAVLNKEKLYFFEEGMISGGVAEKFASLLLENGYHGLYRSFGVGDEFVPHACVDSQMKKYSLDCDSIVNIIEKEAMSGE
ncbi:MAG: 1-deoxy-D-xylulose-5-phosphate synthase [Clostridia bacterium]|nr:1-deoxy-D-xylulose-5-phosphate synthase [Clostridia bacterium]